MTPDQQQFINMLGYYLGKFVTCGSFHDDENFLRGITQLEHELKKAKTKLRPSRVIVDPTDVDDDEL